jgi:hypothetical protein
MKFAKKSTGSLFPVIIKSFLKRYLFMILDITIVLIIISGISIFQDKADIVLIVFWFIIAIYSLFLKRYSSFFHLTISTFIAFMWVYIARDNYGYNYNYTTLAGMNLLPVMAWALGMTGALEIFSNFIIRRKMIRFLAFSLAFWVLLIIVETYAFHIINIRDIASGNNVGLPFCNCIHAPWWMRIVYFSMAPGYYAITLIADEYINSFLTARNLQRTTERTS